MIWILFLQLKTKQNNSNLLFKIFYYSVHGSLQCDIKGILVVNVDNNILYGDKSRNVARRFLLSKQAFKYTRQVLVMLSLGIFAKIAS